MHTTIRRPATITWYRSPGYHWETWVDGHYDVRTFNAGSFTETWNGSTVEITG